MKSRTRQRQPRARDGLSESNTRLTSTPCSSTYTLVSSFCSSSWPSETDPRDPESPTSFPSAFSPSSSSTSLSCRSTFLEKPSAETRSRTTSTISRNSSPQMVSVSFLSPSLPPLVSTTLPHSCTSTHGTCSHLSPNIFCSCLRSPTSLMSMLSAIGTMCPGVPKVPTSPKLFPRPKPRSQVMASTQLLRKSIWPRPILIASSKQL